MHTQQDVQVRQGAQCVGLQVGLAAAFGYVLRIGMQGAEGMCILWSIA